MSQFCAKHCHERTLAELKAHLPLLEEKVNKARAERHPSDVLEKELKRVQGNIQFKELQA